MCYHKSMLVTAGKTLKNGLFSSLAGLFVVIVLAGCSPEEVHTKHPKEAKSAFSRTFTIAILPDENVFSQKRRYRPLATYLSERLGMEVKTKVLDSYSAVYSEMLTHKVDAAFFGSLSYLVLSHNIKLEPMVRPVRKDGTSTYRGVIFALRGKGISENCDTWRGKRIALVGKSTTSGYLFPRWYLQNRGVKRFEGYFSKIIYAGSHDAAILAVLRNEADIGCSTDRTYNLFLDGDPFAGRRLVVLATSAPFPSNSLALRTGGLDPAIEVQMKEYLLGLENTEEGRNVLASLRISRFTETRADDYEPVREMMETLGLSPEFFILGQIGRSGNSKSDGRAERR